MKLRGKTRQNAENKQTLDLRVVSYFSFLLFPFVILVLESNVNYSGLSVIQPSVFDKTIRRGGRGKEVESSKRRTLIRLLRWRIKVGHRAELKSNYLNIPNFATSEVIVVEVVTESGGCNG